MEFIMSWKVMATFMLIYGSISAAQTPKSTGSTVNKVYRVTTILSEPFVSTSGSVTSKNVKFTGFIPELLDRISTLLGVSFVINHVGDSRYGSKDITGNWTGMIGELKNNVSDIAAAPLTITAERAKHVNFSHPFLDTGLRILVKKPVRNIPLGDEIFQVFRPFNFEIWIIILLAIVAVSIQFFIIGRYNPKEMQEKKNHVDLTLSNAFFFSFSILTWQVTGYSVTPKSHSARILAAFWWLCATVTIIMYIANVTALFLPKYPSQPIVPFYTFDEMSKQTEVKYGYVKYGATAYYFKNSNKDTEQRINSFVNENPEVMMDSNKQGINKVRAEDGKYAFIMEGAMAEYIAAQVPCDLMVVGEFLNDRAYAFACRPEIGICRDLDVAILQLKQNKEIEDLLLKHLSGTCQTYKADMMCSLSEYGVPLKTDVAAVRSINRKRFAGSLILLLIGMFLSIIVLILEIFLAKRKGINYGRKLQEDKQTFREPADVEIDGDQFL